ncbi:hypothetical protein D3C86_1314040 [compost metagenome]
MVGVVVVDLRLDLIQYLADVGLLEAQAKAFAQELRTVHAAPGVAGFTIATAGGQFQQGVCIRRPADGHVAVPFVVARRHCVVVAVLVVVGVRGVADDPHVTRLTAGCGVHQFVEAAVGAGQHAGVDPCAEFAEVLRLAVEQDSASRGTRSPQHGLRALDYGEFVVGFRRDVGSRGVHPARAGTEHHAAVGEDVQPRTEHAAQHRVTIGAAVAHHGKAGDGFQVIGAIAGRHRLARVLGIGDDGQWRTGRNGGNHCRAQFFSVTGVFIGQRRRRQQSTAQDRGGVPETSAGFVQGIRGLGRAQARDSGKPGHDNFHRTVVNDTAGSLRNPCGSERWLSCGPCEIRSECLRDDGRGAGTGAGEEGLPGMALARRGCGEGIDGRDDEVGERHATGQRRAIEQQAAIAALFP